jgi:hypothetical protein
VPPQPYRAKDFTLVKRGGVYHVFYTQVDTSAGGTRSERQFGHAISKDFWSWSERMPVLPVSAGLWEHTRVWSPHILEVDSVYYMFYTGVNEDPDAGLLHQERIGVAVSTDLFTWNRQPAPLWECADVPWSVCDPSQPLGGDLRDPFVMPDPAAPGGYLMYYITRLGADPGHLVAGLASSQGLEAWSDQGPLMVTDSSTTFSPVTESPHVFEHDGLYYLFWTTNAGQPLVFASSTDPHGGWSYRGRLSWMLGINTQTWFASESFSDGAVDYFAFVNFDRVDMRRIQWLPDGTGFTLAQPDTFHVFNMSWSDTSAVPGEQVTLFFEALGCLGRRAGIELWEVDADGAWEHLDNALYGLPDSVTFTSRLYALPWSMPTVEDDDEADTQPELLVRLADGTCQTGILHGRPSPEGLRRERERNWTSGEGDLISFRLRPHSPLASGPALLLDLHAAGRARVELFDLAGRRVGTLLDEDLPQGPRIVTLERVSAPRGLYFARLSTPAGRARVVRVFLAR